MGVRQQPAHQSATKSANVGC